MLNTAKQDGPTCLAFALYNAGIVSAEARDEYHQLALDGHKWLLQHDMFYALFGSTPNPESQKYCAGSEELATPWLEKYAPDMIQPIYADIEDAVKATLDNEKPDNEVPLEGHGVMLVFLHNAGGAEGGIGTHIVAYDNGLMVDSDAPVPMPETWQSYVERMAKTNRYPTVVKIIPHN